MFARKSILLFVQFVLLSLTGPAFGAWSVTPIVGFHQPGLGDLNEGAFLSPLIVRGPSLEDVTNTETLGTVDTFYDNPLPNMGAGSEAGVEFFWDLYKKDGFIFGLSAWQGVSSSSNTGIWHIRQSNMQSQYHHVTNEREANLSYTQFYLGWRRYLVRKDKKFHLYTNMTLHELFDIDYRDSFFFNIGLDDQGQQTQLTGNKRVIIFKSQATGGMNLGLGLGTEYFFKSWFSIGLQADYYTTLGKIYLKDFRVDHDLSRGSPIVTNGPIARPDSGQAVTFADQGSQSPLYLDFSGWRALLRVNFYF